MLFPIWSVAKTCVRRAAAHSVLPRCFLHVIGVPFSIVASAAVVASSQFVAIGETVCVRVTPTGLSSVAATGAVVFVLPALALRPLQLVGELLDCGSERRVGDG